MMSSSMTPRGITPFSRRYEAVVVVARRPVEEDEPLFTDARDLDLACTGEAMLEVCVTSTSSSS